MEWTRRRRYRLSYARSDMWTAAMDNQLRELWPQSLTTREIGARIGVTKNGVIGRARRLNLPRRPSPIKSDQWTPEQIAYRRVLALRGAERKRSGAVPRPIRIVPISVRNLKPELPIDPKRTCQNIPQDPKVDPSMCGKPAVLGKSWCPSCYARMTVPYIKDKEKRDAHYAERDAA